MEKRYLIADRLTRKMCLLPVDKAFWGMDKDQVTEIVVEIGVLPEMPC